MNVIDALSSSMRRRDQMPNIELAEKIVANSDDAAVAELVENLQNKKKPIRHDCVKVLYEIAERNSKMVSPFVNNFLDLLNSPDNRMVWGAMTAIDAIAGEKPNEVYARIDILEKVTDKGSVITRDHFVSIVAKLVASGKSNLIGTFFNQLKKCPSNQLPMYTERHCSIIKKDKAAEFVVILSARLEELKTEAKRKRVEKVIRKFQ